MVLPLSALFSVVSCPSFGASVRHPDASLTRVSAVLPPCRNHVSALVLSIRPLPRVVFVLCCSGPSLSSGHTNTQSLLFFCCHPETPQARIQGCSVLLHAPSVSTACWRSLPFCGFFLFSCAMAAWPNGVAEVAVDHSAACRESWRRQWAHDTQVSLRLLVLMLAVASMSVAVVSCVGGQFVCQLGGQFGGQPGDEFAPRCCQVSVPTCSARPRMPFCAFLLPRLLVELS